MKTEASDEKNGKFKKIKKFKKTVDKTIVS
jgi:hypothetical protein